MDGRQFVLVIRERGSTPWITRIVVRASAFLTTTMVKTKVKQISSTAYLPAVASCQVKSGIGLRRMRSWT